MKVNKIWRNKKVFLGSCFALATTITVPLLSVSANVNSNASQYVFENKVFKSKDDVFKYLIATNKASINDIKVLGDVDRAYVNSENGMLNPDLLPLYDPNDISFAYKKADGSLTPDRQAAKNTKFNKGLIAAEYDDGYGNHFRSEEMARASMQNKSFDASTYYLDVDYVTGVDPQSGKITTQKKKYNPFSATDYNGYLNSFNNSQFDAIYKGQLKNSSNSSDEYSFIDPNGRETGDAFSAALFRTIKNFFNEKLSSSGLSRTESTSFSITNANSGWHPSDDSAKKYEFSHGSKGTVTGWKTDQPLVKVFVPSYDNGSSWGFEDNTSRSLTQAEVDAAARSNSSTLDLTSASSNNASEQAQSVKEKENVKFEAFKNSISTFRNSDDEIKKLIEKVPKFDIDPSQIQSVVNAVKQFVSKQYDKINTFKQQDEAYDINYNYASYTSNWRTFWNWYSVWDKNYIIWLSNVNLHFSMSYNSGRYDSVNNLINGAQSDFTEDNIRNNLSLDKLSLVTFENCSKKIQVKNFNNVIFDMPVKLTKDTNSGTKIYSVNNNFLDSINLTTGTNYKKYLDLFKTDASSGVKSSYAAIFAALKPNKLIDANNLNDVQEYFETFETKFKELDQKSILDLDSEDLSTSSLQEKIYFADSSKNILSHTNAIKRFFQSFYNQIMKTYDHYKDNSKNLLIDYFKNLDENLEINKWTNSNFDYVDMFARRFAVATVNANSEQNATKAKFVFSTPTLFNAPYSSGFLAQGALLTTQSDFEAFKNNVFNNALAQRLTVYDNNGQVIQVGNWEFDNEVLLEVNAINALEPDISFEYVFVNDPNNLNLINKPVLNQISSIISLTLDDKVHYFKNYKQAAEYVYEYIDKNAQRRE